MPIQNLTLLIISKSVLDKPFYRLQQGSISKKREIQKVFQQNTTRKDNIIIKEKVAKKYEYFEFYDEKYF